MRLLSDISTKKNKNKFLGKFEKLKQHFVKIFLIGCSALAGHHGRYRYTHAVNASCIHGSTHCSQRDGIYRAGNQ